MDTRAGPPSGPAELQPGSEFAGYRIERVLGRGGMSVVYLAEHAGLQRRVALKVLAAHLAEDPSFRERFVRESRIAASLDHPNVVPIYEAGDAEGRLFIAMRYVEGTDLRTLIREQGPLEPSDAVSIVARAADALDAAHRKGLVHRDVKPANILIATGQGESAQHVYLTDFGLTKSAASDSGVTGTGQFVGTIDYAAPEQFEGRSLDAATDVYSLGCVLFECLVGTPPFRRESEAAVMHAHLLESPPSVASAESGVPTALDAVVTRAMAKRPADRYPSATALATAAESAVGDAPSEPVSKARRPILLAAAAISVVALGVAIAIALSGGDDDQRRTGAQASPTSGVNLPAGSVTEIDPATHTPVGVPIEGIPIHETAFFVTFDEPKLAAGAGGVWVIDKTHVTHVDPQRGEVEAEIPYQALATSATSVPDIAIGSRIVWATAAVLPPNLTDIPAGALERIDPATNEQLKRLVFPGTDGAVGVAAPKDSIWTVFKKGILVEVDSRTLDTRRTIEFDGDLDAIAADDDDVWVADAFAGTVVRVDPRTGKAGDPISVGGSIDGIAAEGDSVWVMDAVAGTVTSVRSSGTVGQPLRVGEEATDIGVSSTSSGAAVWVTDRSGTLYQIDPNSNSVTSTDLGGPLAAVAFDEERETLWVLVA